MNERRPSALLQKNRGVYSQQWLVRSFARTDPSVLYLWTAQVHLFCGYVHKYIVFEPAINSFIAATTVRFHQFSDVCSTVTGLECIHSRRGACPRYVCGSSADMAPLAEEVRIVPQVRAYFRLYCLCPQDSAYYGLYRRKTLQILSKASDPQPEPEPEPETFHQFSQIDEGLWAWSFTLRDHTGQDIASVNRAFRGFGREVRTCHDIQQKVWILIKIDVQIFTDTGQYFVRFGPQPFNPEGPFSQAPPITRSLSLEERAVSLISVHCTTCAALMMSPLFALRLCSLWQVCYTPSFSLWGYSLTCLAVNIDFDYFSRHSEGG